MRLVMFDELLPRKGIGYSREHLARLEKAGRFPRRVKIGAGKYGRIGWIEAELDDFLTAKAAARRPATVPPIADAPATVKIESALPD